MSTRSRARPWFALQERLEGYSVEVDRLEEAGGVQSAGLVLLANDFEFERAPPGCPHRFVQSIFQANRFGNWESVAVECVDCREDVGKPAFVSLFGEAYRQNHDEGQPYVVTTSTPVRPWRGLSQRFTAIDEDKPSGSMRWCGPSRRSDK